VKPPGRQWPPDDPRVSKATAVAFVAISALWILYFIAQDSHTILSWALLPLNFAVLFGFLSLLLRDRPNA
jgi:hypothetical protein